MNALTDEVLESMLRTPDPGLEDRGFTSRVLLALPPRRDVALVRAVILSAFTATAALVPLVFVPGLGTLARVTASLLRHQALNQPASVGVATLLIAIAASAVAAVEE